MAWSWDAATLTARVRIPSFDPAAGASARVTWRVGDAPRSNLLCNRDGSRQRRPGFVGLNARALAIKQMVDWEAYLGTKPSMALNLVVGTTTRMDRNHAAARGELGGFDAALAVAVELHTNASHASGRPSAKLQAVMAAWLGR